MLALQITETSSLNISKCEIHTIDALYQEDFQEI